MPRVVEAGLDRVAGAVKCALRTQPVDAPQVHLSRDSLPRALDPNGPSGWIQTSIHAITPCWQTSMVESAISITHNSTFGIQRQDTSNHSFHAGHYTQSSPVLAESQAANKSRTSAKTAVILGFWELHANKETSRFFSVINPSSMILKPSSRTLSGLLALSSPALWPARSLGRWLPWQAGSNAQVPC